jgi:hypothetical protein
VSSLLAALADVIMATDPSLLPAPQQRASKDPKTDPGFGQERGFLKSPIHTPADMMNSDEDGKTNQGANWVAQTDGQW